MCVYINFSVLCEQHSWSLTNISDTPHKSKCVCENVSPERHSDPYYQRTQQQVMGRSTFTWHAVYMFFVFLLLWLNTAYMLTTDNGHFNNLHKLTF